MTSPDIDELLAELRRHQKEYPSLVHSALCGQAADEIDRLRARLHGSPIMKRKPPDDTPERNDTDNEEVARRIAIDEQNRRHDRDGSHD